MHTHILLTQRNRQKSLSSRSSNLPNSVQWNTRHSLSYTGSGSWQCQLINNLLVSKGTQSCKGCWENKHQERSGCNSAKSWRKMQKKPKQRLGVQTIQPSSSSGCLPGRPLSQRKWSFLSSTFWESHVCCWGSFFKSPCRTHRRSRYVWCDCECPQEMWSLIWSI